MTTSSAPDRCNYRDIAGRRCRLPRKPNHPDLCAHHARLNPEGCLEDPQALTAEILGETRDFHTAVTVNQTVSKLLELLISRRIPARQVAVAGYLCQLLLQTLPHLERERPPETFQFISHIPRPDYSKARANQQPPEGNRQ